ncbi:MAG: PadR family transcriptional regulator [Clostridiales bacterium]|nr:PadR family transcriptional regulator [Clostridiales bacterium]
MENKAISSDLIRGHVDTIILHALLDGDKFPQQISELVEKKSDGKYELNQATLYSSLKRLETLKFVQSYWHDTIGGRRKYYKLTDLGKETVDANLSNWSYSRAIIDKLMDVEPTGIVKTQYVEVVKEVPVEKIVEKVVEVEKVIEKPVAVQPKTVAVQQPIITDENSNGPSSIKVSEPIIYHREETEQEKNFRNILNGLISATRKDSIDVPVKQEKPTEKAEKPIKPIENTTKQPEILQALDKKQSFTESIEETHKFALKENYGKIDFSDLAAKVAKDGYKLRISSKGPRVAKGSLYVNKINFISSVFAFALCLVQFLIIVLAGNSTFGFTPAGIIIPLIAMIIFPIIMFAIFKKAPLKTVKRIKGDTILTSLIIVFNLILITFAGCLLFNANLSDTTTLCYAFIFPMLIYVDSFIYFVIRFMIAKYNKFNVSKVDE